MATDPLAGPNRHAYCLPEIRRLRAELDEQQRRTNTAIELIDKHLRHYNTVGAIHPHGGLNAIRDALVDTDTARGGPT